MRILKVINNNVVSALNDNGAEVIVMGKGIGFQKKSKDEIDSSNIEKIFSIPEEKTGNFAEMVEKIPYEHIRIADEAIDYASKRLHRELNRNIYITMTDHLSYSIERQKNGIVINNALLWEIKKFYPAEYEIGCDILDMVKEQLGIELSEDEAGFLALHIVNAEMEGDGQMSVTGRMPGIIRDILNIVRYSFPGKVDEGSLNYERFLTHLKFFVQRAMRNESYDDKGLEVYDMLREKYKEAYSCAEKVSVYMREKHNYDVPEPEKYYLVAHIARITSK